MSEEQKKKISFSLMGHKHTEETKRKISEAHKNKERKHSFETRKKIADACRGEKNHNWKDGITSENNLVRGRSKMKLWKKAVFIRDNYTCQKYKVKGGKIVAHHINNFADFPTLRTILSNGITLSEKAHKEFHRKYGNRNTTKKQLDEFLAI